MKTVDLRVRSWSAAQPHSFLSGEEAHKGISTPAPSRAHSQTKPVTIPGGTHARQPPLVKEPPPLQPQREEEESLCELAWKGSQNRVDFKKQVLNMPSLCKKEREGYPQI